MKFLSTKVVMWIYVALNVLVGVFSLLTGQSAADTGWGSTNVMTHDKFYEQGYGIAFLAIAVIAFGITMWTTGKVQAKLTLLSGLATAVFMFGFAIMASANSPKYTIGVPYWIFGGVLILLTAISGSQGLKSDN